METRRRTQPLFFCKSAARVYVKRKPMQKKMVWKSRHGEKNAGPVLFYEKTGENALRRKKKCRRPESTGPDSGKMDRQGKFNGSVDPDSSGTSPDGSGAVGDTFPFPAAGGGGGGPVIVSQGGTVSPAAVAMARQTAPRAEGTLLLVNWENPVPFDRPEGLVTSGGYFWRRGRAGQRRRVSQPGGGRSGKKDVSGGPGGGDRPI